MVYAILVCSNGDCQTPFEAWGDAPDLEALNCEDCGDPLDVVAFSRADRDGVVPGSVELQPRRAA